MRVLFLGLCALACLLPSACNTNESPVEPVDTGTATQSSILAELNLARNTPHEYAQYLRDRRKYFDGLLYKEPGKTPLQTNEGVAAFDEAIEYLDNVGALPKLDSSKGLRLAAEDHRNDTGPKGIVGHSGSDGSTVDQRVKRYGSFGGTASWGENISYGMSTPRDIIIQWIVDDGVSGRGHRLNIFNGNYTHAGIAYGTHSVYSYMCVLDLASGYTSK